MIAVNSCYARGMVLFESDPSSRMLFLRSERVEKYLPGA